jgi:hypothetical protein
MLCKLSMTKRMWDGGFESLSHPENLKNLYSHSQPENFSTFIK